ncbi:hypothetical protein F441_22385 [Phytophthora nicotianae CJ01A1]|uniref:Uncharacterized protein n=2 Tax=Phytophthora nicotianae TaxID=4792 RepID=W2VPE1_PHYNI|nr:hypothetical protein L916_14053 [Phytophthora nicotianae]ETP00197.1 hypothetical protein F441_22385 [Phytophthora nicotianae CJ01A1]
MRRGVVSGLVSRGLHDTSASLRCCLLPPYKGLEDDLVSSSYPNERAAASSRQWQRPLQNQLAQQRLTGSKARWLAQAELAALLATANAVSCPGFAGHVTGAGHARVCRLRLLPWLFPGESTVQRTCCFAYAVLGASLEHQQASRRSEVEHSSPPAPSTVEDHGP